MPPTKILWNQADRETPQERERRTILQAQGLLAAMQHICDEGLDGVWHRAPKLFERLGHTLQDALTAARVWLEAYDYFQARCAEAGMSPEDAAAAWDLHVTPEFERELVEAEGYGPNAIRMLDETVLRTLQIAPAEPAGEEE
jgi:hypothetical protein